MNDKSDFIKKRKRPLDIYNLSDTENIESGGSNVTKLDIFVKKYNRKFGDESYDKISPYNVNSLSHYKNEIDILPFLEKYNLVPKILDFNNDSLILSNCGEVINKNNVPIDWKYQFTKIYEMLKNENIYHNDFTISNVTIKDNKIYLIDFGWASYNKPSYPYFNLNKDMIDNSNTVFELFENILNKAINNRINNILSFNNYINNNCRKVLRESLL